MLLAITYDVEAILTQKGTITADSWWNGLPTWGQCPLGFSDNLLIPVGNYESSGKCCVTTNSSNAVTWINIKFEYPGMF